MTVLQVQQQKEESTVTSALMELELTLGQCTVVQCNYEHGRQFIGSILGEPSNLGYNVQYRGASLHLQRSEMKHRAGLCLLDDGVYSYMSVRDFLQFWARLYKMGKPVDELLGAVGLEAKAKVRLTKLSISEKRRLSFARSIVHEPELVIWEDPEQNLDLDSCIIVRKLIASLIEQGKTVLVTCSTMEQAISLSEHVYRLTENGFQRFATQEEAEPAEQTAPLHADILDIKEPYAEQPETETAIPKLAKLMVKSDDKYVFIDPSNIYYVESNDGLSHIHTGMGEFAVTWTLTEMESRLAPHQFYRCHRSYLVNLQHAAELIVWSRNSYSLVIGDGKKSMIPMSKAKFEELKAIVGSQT
ncbi:LytTR family transcriptional regulator DNA-binding domain-containing protein [Paenibacillus sp. NPDC057967]|uniref:LytTR family transcriptional regulator DNA-binding domain-containing protein n=1 Tax=Paenibacillus sp. NPDC057967 TaxID=3346293 RepID=UPI0036D96AF6